MFKTSDESNRQRILDSVGTIPESDCWIWCGQISNTGYGRIMLSGPQGRSMESAHRASYTAFVGPIPERTIVRQICGNRLCVNPDHLEIVAEKSW